MVRECLLTAMDVKFPSDYSFICYHRIMNSLTDIINPKSFTTISNNSGMLARENTTRC